MEEADLALSLKSYNHDREQWAMANIDYAQALTDLGDEESQPLAFRYYQNAIMAYENALKVYTKKKDFAIWSAIMVALAQLLRSYGKREGGEMGVFRLQRAEKLIHQVLSNLSPQEKRLEIALLKLECGYIYQFFAETDRAQKRESYIEKAIFSFQEAKNNFRLKESFDYWAGTLFILGTTLLDYAKLQDLSQARFHIKQAIENLETAYRYFVEMDKKKDALQVLAELSYAYIYLYQYSKEEDRYKTLLEVRDCFEMLHSSFNDLDSFSKPAQIKLNCEFADILFLLAQSEETKEPFDFLEKSINLYQNALTLLKEEKDELNYILVKGYLGKIYSYCANFKLESEEKEKEIEFRRSAVKMLREASDEILKKSNFVEWLSNYTELAAACHTLADRLSGKEREALYLETISFYKEIGTLFLKKEEPVLWAHLQKWKGLAHYSLADMYRVNVSKGEKQIQQLNLAKQAFHEALSIFKLKDFSSEYAEVQEALCYTLYSLGELHEEEKAKKELFLKAKNLSNHIFDIKDEVSKKEENFSKFKISKKISNKKNNPCDWLYLKLIKLKISLNFGNILPEENKNQYKDSIFKDFQKFEVFFEEKEFKKNSLYFLNLNLEILELYLKFISFLDNSDTQYFIFLHKNIKKYFENIQNISEKPYFEEHQFAFNELKIKYQSFLKKSEKLVKKMNQKQKWLEFKKKFFKKPILFCTKFSKNIFKKSVNLFSISK